MSKKILLHLWHACAFFFLISTQTIVHAQTYEMTLGYRRPLNSDWFGLNSQNSVRDSVWISNPDVLKNVPLLHPNVIRFPGSDIANWWDWKAGWFVNSPVVPEKFPGLTPMPNRLEDFKLLVDATGATPLFDLNMITSDLQYQLQMLKHADSIGIPVKYVELGSEYYLADEVDSNIIYSIFPDAQTYGTVSTIWIDSIHHYFPNAKVAAQGAYNRSGPLRRLTWDTSMIKTLVGEDAISYHEYYNASGNETQGQGDGLYTPGDVPDFMYRPFKAWNILATQDLPTVRPGREVWITEYNLQDTSIPVHGSWGHGLFVATQSLLFLESQLISHVYFYTMDGSAYGAYFDDKRGLTYGPGSIFVQAPNPPPTTPWSLSAAGEAINLVSLASDGMMYASPLSFSNVPAMHIIDDGDSVSYPSIYGWQFSNTSSSSAVIVNLSSVQYKIVTTKSFPSGGTFDKYFTDPLNYVADDSEITYRHNTFDTSIVLLPYSITKVISNDVPKNPPLVKIKTKKPTTFCEGDSVQLDAGGGYATYQWSTGETTRKIWAKATSNYWVRAWKDADGYYASDTVLITVNQIPDTPVIINSGKDAFCLGQSVTLSPFKADSLVTYTWSTGVSAPSLTVSAAGTYSVTAVNNYGCSSVSANKIIAVYPLPQPVLTASGSTDICSGKNVTLSTTSSYSSYLWSTNKYGATLKVTASGSYTVTVTDTNKCSATSNAVGVTAHTVPVPSVSIFGPTAFCDGNSPTYLSTIGGYNYQWNKGAVLISGATNRKYYPTAGGGYVVTVTDGFGCSQKSSTVNITVLNLPSANISVAGSKNICNGQTRIITASTGIGFTYQWMKNGVNIAGGIAFTYTAGTAGDYQCKVIDANGCSKLSNIVTLTSNCKATDDLANSPVMTAYPNPASDIIHIAADFDNVKNETATLEIRNMLGELIYAEEETLQGDQFSSDVSLDSKFASGVYLATVRSGDHSINKKFIVSETDH